jgi:phosphoglycolate phosphatase-like HAD superfamily hydrolase
MTKILLFDIDGTLCLTGGAGLRAMVRAFGETFAVTDPLMEVPMAGRTDAWIVAQLAAAHGFTLGPEHLAQFRDVYLAHLPLEIEKPGPRKGVMPGIRSLLDALAMRDDVYLALLTGNFEGGARTKLEYFDLWRYFEGGAFGDTAQDRNSLVAEALAAIGARGGPENIAARDVVIIGDTPLDVECALKAGARSIAVATGGYDVGALQAAGADVVFADLGDTAAVLAALFSSR